MAEVKGDLVTPVRKATIPARTNILAFEPEKLNISEISAPTVAPAPKEGANIPPAAPVVKDTIEPIILKKGKAKPTCLSGVNRAWVICDLPDPKMPKLKK